jgi:hypothetical protein
MEESCTGERKREHNQGGRDENYIGKRQKVDRWWSYGARKAIQEEEGFTQKREGEELFRKKVR